MAQKDLTKHSIEKHFPKGMFHMQFFNVFFLLRSLMQLLSQV